ncbi:MAG TPA: alpha/beta fold hydrolase, partial [Candidatus Binataceae bacterium]|nr:alpha/beta fold hydrolase [Candidatus Binataceae bacterium]
MNSTSIWREVAAAGALLASYPLDAVARRGPAVPGIGALLESEPVILVHGFGGNRSNLLLLAAYLKLAGFERLAYFEYPAHQSIPSSADALGRMAHQVGGEGGVHLVGHSLGGTIARWYATGARRGAVRSLVTLGSPYAYG